VGVRDLIVGFLRADVPLTELDPYRRAGADAYGLFDETAPTGWARLAAWNAFLPQVYADNLVSACTSSRYVAADTVPFVRQLYQQANRWLEEALKAQASPSYRFAFHAALAHPLPHWHDPLRTDRQLKGMRATLETGRTRAASALGQFQGEESDRDLLRVRLAQVDAELASVERLWSERPTDELRLEIGHELEEALDHVFELGQLLAQPELLSRIS
jgi:hypothetical protein